MLPLHAVRMETCKVAEMNLPMHFAIRNLTLCDLQRDLLLLHSVLTRSNFRFTPYAYLMIRFSINVTSLF